MEGTTASEDDDFSASAIGGAREVTSFASAAEALVSAGLSTGQHLWFRGHANVEWALTTRFERVLTNSSERQLLNDFEVEATRFIGRPLVATWEVMTLAQHYRVPTRLLDWTTSVQVALHFAVSDEAHSNEDGALYVLDPASLNLETKHKRPEILMFGRTASIEDGSLRVSIQGSASPLSDDPVAVMSPHSFERISNQSGAFVVVPPNAPRMETFLRDGSFERWVIPSAAKEPIREELAEAGYSQYRLFPSLDTAALHVCDRHGVRAR